MINIEGRNLFIREIVDEDLPKLHVWRNSDDFLDLCTNRRSKVSLIDFGYEINRDLRQDRFLQVIVVSKGSESMGTLYAYKFDQTNRTIFVTTYLSLAYRNFGYGVESLFLFARYLFQEINVFKLYVEVYSYNEGVIRMLEHVGFKLEGCLKGHRLRNGERYDLHILAFYAEDLNNQKLRILTKRLV